MKVISASCGHFAFNPLYFVVHSNIHLELDISEKLSQY